MPYALVIFDLDGTLADSFTWFLTIVNAIAREYGFREIAHDEIEPLRRLGPREILRRHEVPLWKLPAIARRMRMLKHEQLDAISLFPGVPTMLHTLREAGLTLSLVSSDNEDNATAPAWRERSIILVLRMRRIALRQGREIQGRRSRGSRDGRSNHRDRR